MSTVQQGKEIVIKIKNAIGVMRDLTKIVAEKGVNVLAVSAWVEGENGIVHLVTDDNLRASDTLREHNYAPVERDVVLVTIDHKPGMLRSTLEKLAENEIDIHHLYASADINDAHCLIVLSTANNDRAIVLLKDYVNQ